MFKKNFHIVIANIFLLYGGIFSWLLIGSTVDKAFAAALTTPIYDAQSSVKINNLADHTIVFVTPSGVASGQAISITFPIQYVMSSFSVSNIDFATSISASCSSFSDASLGSSPSGATWGASQSEKHPFLQILHEILFVSLHICLVELLQYLR